MSADSSTTSPETGSPVAAAPPATVAGETAIPNPFSADSFRLNWSKRDIEQRLGFRGGRFTTVNNWLTFLMGLVLTAGFYAILIFGLQRNPDARWFTAMFLERGAAPYPTMLLFFWGLSILFVKSRKLRFQAEALTLSAVPQQPDFLLKIGRAHV